MNNMTYEVNYIGDINDTTYRLLFISRIIGVSHYEINEYRDGNFDYIYYYKKQFVIGITYVSNFCIVGQRDIYNEKSKTHKKRIIRLKQLYRVENNNVLVHLVR